MPSPFLHAQVRGYQALQRANIEMMQAISPRGGLGEAVKQATMFLHKYSVRVTHRITGTLAASHVMDFASGGLETFWKGIRFRSNAIGVIHISPLTRNPVTGERPVEYGPKEHRRGGVHSFYKRTFVEAGPAAGNLATQIIMNKLPRGRRFIGSVVTPPGGTFRDVLFGGPGDS